TGAAELYLEEKRTRKDPVATDEIDWILDFLLSSREGKKAMELIQEQGVAESPAGKSHQMRYHIARAFYYTGSYKKAEILFQEIYETSNDESLKSRSLLFMARCNIQQGKEQKAIRYYREYSVKFPRSSITGEVLWKLGWLAETQKEFQTALKYYLRLERGRSDYKERGMMRAGCCYYQMKQFRQALRIFDRLAKNGTEESMRQGGYYWKAKILYATGDSISAKNILEHLFTTYPFHYYSFIARQWKGVSNSINTGNPSNLDSLYSQSLDLPDDPKIRRAVRIGEIVGKRYGESELAALQNDSPGRYSDINALWAAYHRIGAFKQSLRIAIRTMKKEEELGKTIPAVSILRKAFPPLLLVADCEKCTGSKCITRIGFRPHQAGIKF
ncbi:MAG: tetratricopeptide repeat protein, partial [Patescibacteria group bacterium]|nr:tetratricopeptide repeat protein [Patescibacteria group bacterium]